MKVCITCQKSVEGKKAVRIREDRIIRTIRSIKQALHIAQMNELYVCEGDIKAQLERRRAFEKNLLLASILAGIVFLLIVASLLLSGNFDPVVLLYAVVIAAFVISLPLFGYAPALESTVAAPVGPPFPGPPTGPEEPPMPPGIKEKAGSGKAGMKPKKTIAKK
jgi:hypothetical protein